LTSDMARHLYASGSSCTAFNEEVIAAYMKGAPLGLWMQVVTQLIAAALEDPRGSMGSRSGAAASATIVLVSTGFS